MTEPRLPDRPMRRWHGVDEQPEPDGPLTTVVIMLFAALTVAALAWLWLTWPATR